LLLDFQVAAARKRSYKKVMIKFTSYYSPFHAHPR
jgi:hypothetical protein